VSGNNSFEAVLHEYQLVALECQLNVVLNSHRVFSLIFLNHTALVLIRIYKIIRQYCMECMVVTLK
jgi:hypothetical protein